MKKRHNSPHTHADEMITRHKNIDIQRMIQDISQLRAQNKTDNEIRTILGIKERTYQRYIKMLYKRNEDIWISLTSNELITELLRLRESLEETYLKAKALSEKEDFDCDSILNSLEVKDNARIDIIKLLSNEGHEIIRKSQLRQSSYTAPEPETTHYVSEVEWRKNGKRVLNASK